MTSTSIPLRERFLERATWRLALVLLALGACKAPGPRDRSWPEPEGSPTPAWVYQPHSWKRLDRIEEWLAGGDVVNHPELVPSAHLELGEGRLRFAREEQGQVEASVMALRLSKAEEALSHVLDEPLASSEQRDRARRGLSEVATLRGTRAAAPRAASAGANADTPGIQVLSRSQWGAKAPNVSRLTPATGRYDRITVHHSAMDSTDLGHVSSGEVREEIRKIQLVHMRDKGFGDVGYHYLIDPRGRIWEGRSLRYQGAHSGGRNNVGNIGICLLGNFDHERPGSPALESLNNLLEVLRKRHGIPRDHVLGHQELSPTQCPGTTLMAWVGRYRNAGSQASAR